MGANFRIDMESADYERLEFPCAVCMNRESCRSDTQGCLCDIIKDSAFDDKFVERMSAPVNELCREEKFVPSINEVIDGKASPEGDNAKAIFHFIKTTNQTSEKLELERKERNLNLLIGVTVCVLIASLVFLFKGM